MLPFCQGSVPHFLREHYPSFFAPTDSCARPNPSPRLRFPYSDESWPVVVRPGGEKALPDVISAALSLDAWTSTATGASSACARFFPETIGLPQILMGRHTCDYPFRDF